MVRFVELTGPLAAFSLPINVGLLAIVWFFTHKLVWDCTFVDMTKDVTATGLLDTVGNRWKKLRDAFDEVDQLASDEVNPVRPTTPNQPAAPWTPFLRWLRHRKANTPGLWVIYFAVLTMPTFGIAQGFIPASDLPSRRWVFQLFVAYILASLGLLMTTSLIGLMRYLHGRRGDAEFVDLLDQRRFGRRGRPPLPRMAITSPRSRIFHRKITPFFLQDPR